MRTRNRVEAEAVNKWLFNKAIQLEVVNLVVDRLTAHAVTEPARLHESPFTDTTPQGPDGLFKPTELDELMPSLQAVSATAQAASRWPVIANRFAPLMPQQKRQGRPQAP